MRIAHVSPLIESVPPHTYGGTERVVSWLVEGMTALGHDVTLFASGDSVTTARLQSCTPRALRFKREYRDPLACHLILMSRVLAEAHRFELIHFHTDLLQFALFRGHSTPCVATLHGRLDLPDLGPFFAEFPEMPLVSISDAQRAPLAEANWLGTVHHGLPEALYPPGRGDGGYLAFLGRLSPEKAPDAAIRIAQRAGMPLRIAAKIDHVDTAYFESTVRPLLATRGVDYVGEISEPEKAAFLGGACALLFPICWPEPFGIVLIEAMACGTPVIAYRAGSAPEVIDDGITGFIVAGEDEAVAAVERVGRLDRGRIRRIFESRFSAARMVADYLDLYEDVIREHELGTAPPLDDELENA